MSVDPVFELEYLTHGLEEMERYLLSEELFWPVLARSSSGGSFLKLTAGNLLLSLKKLEALHDTGKLSRTEEGELRRVQIEIETTQRQWRVAWETKASREYKSRFGQWANVLNDLKKDFEAQSPYYATEVRLRVLLALLGEYAVDTDGYDLAPLDAFLQNLLAPGRFLWEPELERGFPRDKFWFLYGELRDKNSDW